MITEPFIEWNAELSVGIEEIDAQHKVLLSLLNDMHEAIQQQRSREVAKEILEKLMDYTRIHFAVEESLMRILGYPGYEEHKQQHVELMLSIGELSRKMERGKITIGFELQYFLKNWLTKHIIGTDKDYTGYFLQAGIAPKLRHNFWTLKLWE